MIAQQEAIEILTSILASRRPDVEIGAGIDDVAVLRFGGELLAVTVDYTNFSPLGVQLEVSDLSDRGYFLIVHNVSDLLASGARPLAAVVAIAFPRSFGPDDIKQLGMGIRLAADECEVAIVGGDTKEATQLVLNATLLGNIGPSGCWTRAGAQVGDFVFVSGEIGGVSAAVFASAEGIDDPEIRSLSCEALKHPRLPLKVANSLRAANCRIAAIDLSDGLGIDSNRLADASHVGLEIYSDDLPLAPLADLVATRANISPFWFAFGFGGDAQFLFTVSPENEQFAVASGARKIGRVINWSERTLVTPTSRLPLPTFGHEDFTGIKSSERLIQFLRATDR